ncbi:MAG TPA: hypothetical protein VGB97_01790 [Candidatus Paceibacterota bacterium]|jgi:hypothetical protein
MKDQYVGDFGDYQKVSLLRNLHEQDISVLVHWMRTRDDGSTDGKHITYLEKPEVWRAYDAEVYDFFKSTMDAGKRLLSVIEASRSLRSVQFLNAYIEDRNVRAETLDLAVRSGADVVLFDPDNGIEVPSTNRKNVHKYVMWEEILTTINAGKSVIVYQHFSRTSREAFITNKVKEIQQRTSLPVMSIQVRHSVYFFIIQRMHEARMRNAIKAFARTWKEMAMVRPY